MGRNFNWESWICDEKEGITMKIKIEKMGINGEGIGYVNKIPVFVENALIGEVVDVVIKEKQKRYWKGYATNVVLKSADRVKKACRYANVCGACSLMHVRYETQLAYKYDILKQTLIKYAHIDPKKIHKLVKNDQVFGYRNSFKLPFSMKGDQLVCGLYKPNTNHFVAVDKCLIHEKDLERVKGELLQIFNKYHLKAYDYKTKEGLRTLVVRGFNSQYQCCVVSGATPLPKACIEECMNIAGMKSMWQSYHTSKKSKDVFGKTMIHLAGDKVLRFKLKDLDMTLSVKSFFQLHTVQAEKLYEMVASLVEGGNDFIVEAYSGIGAISLYIKDKAKEIVGIEYVNDAVSNANHNAKRNHADNVHFECGDAAEKLVKYSKKRNIDVLVVDPPRSGLDDKMLECILRSRIKKIIYISCNPATLGKNIALLDQKYTVDTVIPIDIFSNTAHVESICLLSRKEQGKPNKNTK